MSVQTIRQTALLESDWKFHLGDIPAPVPNKHISAYMANKAGWAGGAAKPDFDDSDWPTISLPHDWSVEGSFDPANHVDNGFLPQGIGWYRRHFRLEESERGKYLALQFDGVAKHCTVAINGHILHRNFCGYTPFTVDISDIANFGDELNVVAVKVDANPFEGWWYEGAGIYRHVWLIKTSAIHIATYGVFVCPKKISADHWDTEIETALTNATDVEKQCRVQWMLEDMAGKAISQQNATATLPPRTSLEVLGNIEIKNPNLWSPENPNLYRLKTLVSVDGQPADDDVTQFGYRTIRFDADQGFFLNDQRVKVKGTCNHQDHAGVGVAVPDSIQEFRIRRLLEMGTNAYRCAHNPPAPGLLDACDRLGMLVMDENRNFGSSPEHLAQLQTMIRRDRNHPSIILWSICNEEAVQGLVTGASIAKTMQQAVKQLDSSRPVTAAVSGGILNDNAIGSVIEVMGINYQLPLHDQYHAKFPKVPLVAAETHCVLATRGTYKTSESEFAFAADDTELAPWGTLARQTWKHVLSRPFVAGFFAWTGFDYRGEPTPHAWPCVNSFFGLMDTCGFPKDSFFLHKAMLTTENFVHIFPHWNWPGHEGTEIAVRAYSNCDAVELFVNGQSAGKQPIDPTEITQWSVTYQPGKLRAVGYRGDDTICESTIETTGPATVLGLEIHPTFNAQPIPADGQFALPITVFATDSQSRRVPTASNNVTFTLEGPAKILGVGNGDPTSHEPDKSSSRSLFHGLAQAIVQTAASPGQIKLAASASGLQSASLILNSTTVAPRLSVPPQKVRYLISNWRMSPISSTMPDVNRAELEQDMNSWDRIDPGKGSQPAWEKSFGYAIYRTKIRVPKAMQSKGAKLRFAHIGGEAEVFLDGKSVGKKTAGEPAALEIKIPSFQSELQATILIHTQSVPAGLVQAVELLSND